MFVCVVHNFLKAYEYIEKEKTTKKTNVMFIGLNGMENKMKNN